MIASSLVKQAGAPALRGLARRPALLAARELHAGVPSRQKQESGAIALDVQEQHVDVGQSWVEQYKLNEPTRFVPATLGLFGFMTATGIYHIDGESQLMVIWALFCGTIYSRAGPMVHGMLSESRNEILAETRAAEKEHIDALKLAIEAAESNASIAEDVSALKAEFSSVIAEVESSMQGRIEHAMREKVVRQLEMLAQEESKLKERNQRELVDGATKYVSAAYTGKDASKLKAAALDAALKVLSNPESAKKDATVAQLYTNFFKDVRKKEEAKKGKQDKLSAARAAELQAELEAVMEREGMKCDFKVAENA